MTGARRIFRSWAKFWGVDDCCSRVALVALTAAFSLAAPTLAARAQDGASRMNFMGDNAIRTEIVGGSFVGIYSDGRAWRENYETAGPLSYSEGPITVTGHWTLKGGVFCTLYDRQLGGGCWRVRRVASNCFEFYSASADANLATERYWTARGWRTTEAPNCGAPPIS